MASTAPIGVFDSGIGGISTLSKLRSILPYEQYLFYADEKNAPYGTKEPEFIVERLTKISHTLVGLGIKALVLACNTASTVAVKELRKLHPNLPIIATEPAIKPALIAHPDPNHKVLVLGTPLTLSTDFFKNRVKELDKNQQLKILPCPGLMELVEQQANLAKKQKYIKQNIAPHVTEDIKAIVLGCTHYVFLRPVLHVFWPEITFYDGNIGVAKRCQSLLAKDNNLSLNNKKHLCFISSDADSNFAIRADEFLTDADFVLNRPK